ncbi:hypothetical protein V5735_19360 [Haladaptatus sp. SPP-AMP-3]|uniref:prenyltransferase/squalene oxidase repeat-containing protein n=1 Tax=Haladaptatus sp. SPP-AMP-3 TaxID=3121295 RepID=UPI003C3053A9
MNQRTVAILAAILVIFASITVGVVITHNEQSTPAPPHPDPLGVDTISQGTEHFSTTSSLVRRSATPTGSYRFLQTDDPSLYATYYFVTAINRTGWSMTNRNETLQWLSEIRMESYQSAATHSNATLAVLEDRYYVAQTIQTLNGETGSIERLRADINRFRLPDGSYCRARTTNGDCTSSNGSVLATYWAVSTLDTVGGLKDKQRTQTIKWLTSEWDKIEQFETVEEVGLGSRIAMSLRLLGAKNRSLMNGDHLQKALAHHQAQLNMDLENKSLDLGYLDAYLTIAQITGVEDTSFRNRVDELLISEQNSDGGFSVYSHQRSDSMGTALGLQILQKKHLSGTNTSNITNFFAYHALPGGGFAPVSQSTESLQTTYYAVSTLSVLDVDPQYSGPLADRLQSVYQSMSNSEKPVNLKTLFVIAKIAKRSDSPPIPSDIVERSLDAVFARDLGAMSLNQLHAAVAIGQEYGYDMPTAHITERVKNTINPDGSYGSRGLTVSTYHGVKILRLMNSSIPNRDQTVALLRAGRDGGGYRMQQKSQFAPVPDVYATYLSLATLTALDAKPENVTAVSTWLDSLRTDRGSYNPYRVTDSREADPQMQHTYWAVRSYVFLDRNENQSINNNSKNN